MVQVPTEDSTNTDDVALPRVGNPHKNIPKSIENVETPQDKTQKKTLQSSTIHKKQMIQDKIPPGYQRNSHHKQTRYNLRSSRKSYRHQATQYLAAQENVGAQHYLYHIFDENGNNQSLK